MENSCLVTDAVRPAEHSSIFLSNSADFVAEAETSDSDRDNT
jgi:hypothetical protein